MTTTEEQIDFLHEKGRLFALYGQESRIIELMENSRRYILNEDGIDYNEIGKSLGLSDGNNLQTTVILMVLSHYDMIERGTSIRYSFKNRGFIRLFELINYINSMNLLVDGENISGRDYVMAYSQYDEEIIEVVDEYLKTRQNPDS